MRRHFIAILVCPEDQSTLVLRKNVKFRDQEIITGQLICKKWEHKYPITNGIPRFVSDQKYTESFGFEWGRWSRVQFEDKDSDPVMKGYTRSYFQKITTFTPKTILGKTIVEFGCGPGRFLDLLRRDGATVIGLEMSSAVDVARKNLGLHKNVLLVQGDILKPPFKKKCFDAGFTIGVLHHTPNPSQGLVNLVLSVKQGGKVAVSVYSTDGPYNFPSLKLFRNLYRQLRKIFGKQIAQRLAIIYSYLSAYILYYPLALIEVFPKFGQIISYILRKYFFVVMMIKSANWRVLDTFDALTPEIATTHTKVEVKNWLKNAGVIKLQNTRGSTGFIGIKSK